MTENGVARNRLKNGKKSEVPTVTNGDVLKENEFKVRESPLTELIQSSLHIRAIYNIFVVILLVLFCDTVIYDLVERGKQVNITYTYNHFF